MIHAPKTVVAKFTEFSESRFPCGEPWAAGRALGFGTWFSVHVPGSIHGFKYLVQYRTVAVSGPISYLQLGADVYMYCMSRMTT